MQHPNKSPRKAHFLDGCDPRFLLTAEDTKVEFTKEEQDEMDRKMKIWHQARELRKPGQLFNKEKAVNLVKIAYGKLQTHKEQTLERQLLARKAHLLAEEHKAK